MSALNTAIPEQNVPRKLVVKAHLSVPNMENAPARILLNEDAFVSMLYLERRRAERAPAPRWSPVCGAVFSMRGCASLRAEGH